jgi:chloramphenicol 3-O phosphotransferase
MSGIIFLHGPSSSGKSTLARAVQGRIDTPFWHYSIDHLRDSGVLPSARFKSGEFVWREHRAAFFEGFHQSIGAFADAGNNLIVEHILDTPGWAATLADRLAVHEVLFVGLRVSLAELNRREAARGDRPLGSAETDYHTVHNGLRYDLEVDTERSVDANAEAVIAAWEARPKRSVFFDMGRQRLAPSSVPR